MSVSWFAAANAARARATALRGQAAAKVSPHLVEATEEALRIFTGDTLMALRATWIAEGMEALAEEFDRRGREDTTLIQDKGKSR